MLQQDVQSDKWCQARGSSFTCSIFTLMNYYTESQILAMVVLLVRRSWAALHMLMIYYY